MDFAELRLNELPFHLDVVAFWVMALGIGLGSAFAIKKLSDMMARTDRIAADKSRAGASAGPTATPAESGADKPQLAPLPSAANANMQPEYKHAA